MPTISSFKGVTNFSQSLFTDNLLNNLCDFFDWGFLGIGAFANISRGTSGVYGGNPARLRCVDDPYFVKGKIWEGYRNNWVWQSGVEYFQQPTQISGVYVNSSLLPNDGSNYYIDYPRGRIVFNTAISTNSLVETEYSYKYVGIHNADSYWFKQLQFNSLRVDDVQFLAYGSGVWSILSANRVQLPAVVIEAIPNRSMQGMQLGGGEYIYQGVRFNIFAETPFDRNNLMDIISFQYRKRMYLYDRNQIAASSQFPLTLQGSLSNNPLCYPDLLNLYQKRSAYFFSFTQNNIENTVPGLYNAEIEFTFEVDYPEL